MSEVTVDQEMENDFCLDDENEAFFNAPKVTTRDARKIKEKITSQVNDDEEGEGYDENVDTELNEKIAQHLKDFFAKKVTAKNAFETQLLDKLPAVAQVEPLQCVGAMLDASARVYAFRVDNTHGECFTVRTTFDEKKKKTKRNEENAGATADDGDDAEAAGCDDDNNDEDSGMSGEEGGPDHAPNKNNEKKTSRTKKNFMKGVHNAELYSRLEDLYAQSEKLVDKFSETILDSLNENYDDNSNGDIAEEDLRNSFADYISEVHNVITSRRIGVPFIEQKMLGLNSADDEYSIDDPIYNKVAKQFEEGCAQSFVNNEVLMNRDGSFFILHTNWKEEDFQSTESTMSGAKDTTNTELLEKMEVLLGNILNQNSSDFFLVTRFAPLIDCIWHSVIKVATEDDFSKMDIFAGKEAKEVHKIFGRHAQSSAQRTGVRTKKTYYSTPTHTPSVGALKGGKRARQLELETNMIRSDDDNSNDASYAPSVNGGGGSGGERIYFWARPRQYPVVYLGQLLDEKDNPMAQGVELLVDTEEMLVGLDDEKLDSVSVNNCEELTDGNSVLSPDKQNLVSISVENTPSKNQANCSPLYEMDNDYDVGAVNDDYKMGEENAGTAGDLPEICQLAVNDVADNELQAILLEQENNDIEMVENIPVEAPVDDDCHWKGGGAAEVVDEKQINAKLLKSRKKTPAKTKRRRIDPTTELETGGVLTEEMFWLPAELASQETLKSIKKHQTPSSSSEIQHSIDRRRSGEAKLFLEKNDFPKDDSGGNYDPHHFIEADLMYKNSSGFWSYIGDAGSNMLKFVPHPNEFKTESFAEQTDNFLQAFAAHRNAAKIPTKPAKLAVNGMEVLDEKDEFSLCNFDIDPINDAPMGLCNSDDSMSIDGADYDDIRPGVSGEQPEDVDGGNDDDELKFEEQLEFNGGVIKIHQSRVKAPAVKKAIVSILSTTEYDLNALTKARKEYLKDKLNSTPSHQLNESDEQIVHAIEASSQAEVNNLESETSVAVTHDDSETSSTSSGSEEFSDEDEEHQNQKDTSELKSKINRNAVKCIVNGTHTYESLLASLPSHLSGRTKRDLNAINTFAITLHMCNEHQIRLSQEKDDDLLVTEHGMSTFRMESSK